MLVQLLDKWLAQGAPVDHDFCGLYGSSVGNRVLLFLSPVLPFIFHVSEGWA